MEFHILSNSKLNNTQFLCRDILHKLLYSEVFKHPLTKQEIFVYSKVENEDELEVLLDQLLAAKLISRKEDYFFVFEDSGRISRRQIGNEKAQKLIAKSHRIGRLINKFPYVEGVGISGSLSKGVLHDDGDFDYFIITKPERLWVARTSLIFFKKLFLFNSRKYFCVNYFIDSKNLEINEKNLFTAMEIGTLIPTSGDVMNRFFSENDWISDYFPKLAEKKNNAITIRKPLISKCIMWILDGRFGAYVDERFMRLTLKTWNKKFGEFENDKFDLTMKTRKYISKHHPNDFQNKVLSKHQDLIDEFSSKHCEELKKLEITL